MTPPDCAQALPPARRRRPEQRFNGALRCGLKRCVWSRTLQWHSTLQRCVASLLASFAIEDHATVMQFIGGDERAIGGEAGVVPILDPIAFHFIAALIGTLACAAGFV